MDLAMVINSKVKIKLIQIKLINLEHKEENLEDLDDNNDGDKINFKT